MSSKQKLYGECLEEPGDCLLGTVYCLGRHRAGWIILDCHLRVSKRTDSNENCYFVVRTPKEKFNEDLNLEKSAALTMNLGNPPPISKAQAKPGCGGMCLGPLLKENNGAQETFRRRQPSIQTLERHT